MPVIKIEGPKITKDQKNRIVKEIIPQLSEIYNIPVQAFVTYVKENELENIGVGNELLADRYNSSDK
ncbi:4-oxalocrotonate tautomerase DmpI [Anaerosolibacter sp.]|uniref:4-oxalocrotonate tautomerase DmpI n=1 Tax=Anaerosolibacter sp. TaxID=1872527 RepID=UPI0039EE31BE